MYSNELYHHGILGQKWGVRRFQNPDGSYKKGAEGRYNGKTNDNKTGIKFEKTSGTAKATGLTEKQKTALKVAGVAVAAGLAAYGAYKVSELNQTAISGIRDKYIKDYKDSINAHMKLKDLAAQAYDYADKAKIRDFSDLKNNPAYNVQLKIAERADKRAEEFFERGAASARKAGQTDYTIKEKIDFLKENKKSSK